MKKLIFTCLFMVILFTTKIFGQLDHIMEFKSSKDCYTSFENVEIQYNCFFPNQPCSRDSVHINIKQDTVIAVDAFYSVGDAMSPCANSDNISVGTLSANEYTVILNLTSSDSLFMASDTIKLTVEESPASGLQHIFDLVTSQELFEEDDSVVLKYNYSFPSSPVTRDSVSYIFKNDSCILANVYYSVGDLTIPEGGKDSVNLGILPTGNYSLILHVVGNENYYFDSDTAYVKIIEDTEPAISYITSLDLIKNEYTPDDSIIIKYSYNFPYQPCSRDSVNTVLKNDTCIYIDVYYSVGDAASPCAGTDSIGLDKLPVDDYYIYFNLIAGAHAYTDSDTLSLNVKQGSNGINQKTLNGIHLYPNPAIDELFISYHTSFKIDAFSIHAINGQMIKSANIEDLSESIDISDIPGGMYVIKFYSKKSIFSVNKFIKGNL